jgi:hypothetical protein
VVRGLPSGRPSRFRCERHLSALIDAKVTFKLVHIALADDGIDWSFTEHNRVETWSVGKDQPSDPHAHVIQGFS